MVKKKNKDLESQIITTVLIQLLVLAAIVIVWQVVQGNIKIGLEPDFKITKEECTEKVIFQNNSISLICTNKTDYNHMPAAYSSLSILCAMLDTENGLDEFNKSFYERRICITSDNKKLGLCGVKKEICEQVEVDYFRYDYPCFLDGSYKENSESCLILFEVMGTKENPLSKDWLNENCECDFEKPCDEVYRIKEPDYWYCNTNGSGTTSVPIEYCDKYKCGEYYVERK